MSTEATPNSKPVVTLQPASLGRTVHYVDTVIGHPHRAALITHVHAPDCVDLQVFNPASSRPVTIRSLAKIKLVASTLEPGTCHWPEREVAV